MRRFLLTVITALMLCSCGQESADSKVLSRKEAARIHREDSLALKIAVTPSADILPLLVAKDRCLYDTTRLDLRLKIYRSVSDCDTSFMAGRVEGMCCDIANAEWVRSRGHALSYLTLTPLRWHLVANRKARAKTLRQLSGKMVAMTLHATPDTLTARMAHDIPPKSVVDGAPGVFGVQVDDVDVRLGMMSHGVMDAAWLAEPYSTAALSQGHNTLYSTPADMPLGAIVLRGGVLDDPRIKAQVATLTKAYNAACDSINRYGMDEYRSVLARYCNVTPTSIKRMPKAGYSHVTPPDAKHMDKVKTYLKNIQF